MCRKIDKHLRHNAGLLKSGSRKNLPFPYDICSLYLLLLFMRCTDEGSATVTQFSIKAMEQSCLNTIIIKSLKPQKQSTWILSFQHLQHFLNQLGNYPETELKMTQSY